MFSFSFESWFFFGLSTMLAFALLFVSLRQGKKSGPILCFHSYGTIVIDRESRQSVPNVSVQHKGRDCPSLSVSRLLFWNGGDAVLDKAMLVIADPIKAICNQGVILECQVEDDFFRLAHTVTANFAEHSDELQVEFDFLNPGEGFALRVLHTSVDPAFRPSGALKGATLKHVKDNRTSFSLGWAFVATVALMLLGLAASLYAALLTYDPDQEYKSMLLTLPLLIAVAIAAAAKTVINRALKSPIPESLNPPHVLNRDHRLRMDRISKL